MATRSLTPAKRVDLTVALEGPFFTKDPAKTFRQNIRVMLDALGKEAEQDVRNQMRGNAAQMPYWTGHSLRHVLYRTRSLRTGRPYAVTVVIEESTDGMGKREAIRTKAAGASIERRFHPFRRTATAIRRSRAVLSANLTRGLE